MSSLINSTVFVEVFSQNQMNHIYEVTLESLITLFVIKLGGTDANIELKLISLNKEAIAFPKFTIDLSSFNFDLIENLPELAKLCQRPVLIKNSFVVSGLCSVARQIIKHSNQEQICKLLGFREACLMACSESSIWTKFCEIDIILTVKKLLLDSTSHFNESCDIFTFPVDVVRFENHLRQPVKTHNIYKLARLKNNDKSIKSGSSLDDLQMDHIFAEGVFATLSDVILLIPYKIISILTNNYLEKLPNTLKWFKKICENFEVLNFNFAKANDYNKITNVVLADNVPNVSLYTSDPKRYRPQSRIFTKDNDVENALNSVDILQLQIRNENCLYGNEILFDWKDIPIDANPEGGALPKKRANRKCDQLSSLAKAVVKIVNKEKMRIVDFCSGSGHLGILIAFLLPQCEIILVENKERSLDRAFNTINKIGLTNVKVIQCNLDYFNGDFDLGTCLHACGVATDLVIQTCISKNAHFVACPCCYGSIHNCYHLTYPRSLQMATLSQKEYLNIAHAADQTHKDNSKTVQGFKCMDIIDYDRKLQAESKNYVVHLGKLHPLDCTPKNNLLVGIFTK